MTLCLVTDRHRVGGTADALVEQVRAAVEAGIDLVQVRERDIETADLAALMSRILRVATGSKTRIVVNDRLDVALACGADGVHLRGDSVPASAARRLAPGRFLVGRSIHSVEEARAAGDVDYVIAGTVFPSSSKPDARGWLGVEGLRAVVAAAEVPVLGIGGITVEKLRGVAAAGAVGIAAIGLFATVDRARMRALVEAARLGFGGDLTAQNRLSNMSGSSPR